VAIAPLDFVGTDGCGVASPPGLCVSRRVEGSLTDETPRSATRYAFTGHDWLLKILCGFAAVAVLIAKIPLIWRININWDEFYFLSHVHSLLRGDLDLLMQGAYTHLFTWATWSGVDEVAEIGVLRLSMWPLLALSCFLLYRLARRWASPAGAWFAVFAFVASWPVLRHGLSFRSDSLLLPLTLAALLLASKGQRRVQWGDVGCGVLVGLAMTLTIKAALLLPTLVAVACLEAVRMRNGSDRHGHHVLRRLAVVACACGIAMALILAVHANFIAVVAERPEALLSRTLRDTVLDVPWLPRWIHFQRTLAMDPLTWLLLAAGLVVALVRRHYGAAACATSLLPILFYRNAFPYYYVVMLAPACVVIAVAIDGIRNFATRYGRGAAGTWVTLLFFLLLAHGAWDHAMTLRFDEQGAQRSVVAAVHRIFPEPVPYIDHSGMISSFPKANFFMSTWGIESYVARGEDVVAGILAAKRPPLLLVNHSALVPGSLLFRRMSRNDQSLLRSSYVAYWGPIRVAGAELTVPAGGHATARLPFAGSYRVESDAPILIGERRYDPGDRIEWRTELPALPVRAFAPGAPEIRVRLVWAAAREPPVDPPPARQLYTGL
jgi:Dolichyl-phosphate-mannose-protein mannosyltransferase